MTSSEKPEGGNPGVKDFAGWRDEDMAVGTAPHCRLPAPVRLTAQPLGSVFNIGPFPMGGSGTTLNNGEYYLAAPYRVTLGPSMRQIVDFSDINGALSIIPTGESGQPMHEHYSDQTPLWLSGEYHVMPIDSARVAQAAKHTLSLLPGN